MLQASQAPLTNELRRPLDCLVDPPGLRRNWIHGVRRATPTGLAPSAVATLSVIARLWTPQLGVLLTSDDWCRDLEDQGPCLQLPGTPGEHDLGIGLLADLHRSHIAAQ